MVTKMKVMCYQCKETKDEDEFYKSCLEKKDYCCKKCHREKRDDYKKNIDYFLNIAFQRQKHSKNSKVRYTKNEFIRWCKNNPDFKDLFLTWKISGYPDKLKPCIIRMNSSDPWTLDNLLFVDKENLNTTLMESRSEKVTQLDGDGNIMANYVNARQASLILGLPHYTGIIRSCKRNHVKSYGFYWKYTKDVSTH